MPLQPKALCLVTVSKTLADLKIKRNVDSVLLLLTIIFFKFFNSFLTKVLTFILDFTHEIVSNREGFTEICHRKFIYRKCNNL